MSPKRRPDPDAIEGDAVEPGEEIAGGPLNPWDRRPSDTDKSWRAFVVYRELGPTRTLRQLVEGDPNATPPRERMGSDGQIRLWSRTHDWVARAKAFDEAEERAFMVDQAVARRDARRAVRTIARASLGKAGAWVRMLNPALLTPMQGIRLMEVSAKLLEQATSTDALSIPDDEEMEEALSWADPGGALERAVEELRAGFDRADGDLGDLGPFSGT